MLLALFFNWEEKYLKVGYVYRHWIINDKGIEKSYIGITIQKPSRRWREGNSYLQRDTKFSRAIKKYGWDNFTHEILEEVKCATREEVVEKLKTLEIKYVAEFDSYKNGYNMTEGGDHIGNNKGESHHMFGKNLSEKTKQKISASKIKYFKNGGKHPKGMKGKTHSEEYKERLRQEMKGEGHPFYGKTHTEESRQKISQALKEKECYKGANNPSAKAVLCLETGEVFSTMKEACEWCGLKYSTTIIKSCKDANKTAGKHPITGEKLHWQYYVEKI